jgi:hypothetical protein
MWTSFILFSYETFKCNHIHILILREYLRACQGNLLSCTAESLLNFTYLTADFDESVTAQETTSTPSTTVDNLLLGHTILPTYTPPKGTRVQTDSGHSKVTNSPQRSYLYFTSLAFFFFLNFSLCISVFIPCVFMLFMQNIKIFFLSISNDRKYKVVQI